MANADVSAALKASRPVSYSDPFAANLSNSHDAVFAWMYLMNDDYSRGGNI